MTPQKTLLLFKIGTAVLPMIIISFVITQQSWHLVPFLAALVSAAICIDKLFSNPPRLSERQTNWVAGIAGLILGASFLIEAFSSQTSLEFTIALLGLVGTASIAMQLSPRLLQRFLLLTQGGEVEDNFKGSMATQSLIFFVLPLVLFILTAFFGARWHPLGLIQFALGGALMIGVCIWTFDQGPKMEKVSDGIPWLAQIALLISLYLVAKRYMGPIPKTPLDPFFPVLWFFSFKVLLIADNAAIQDSANGNEMQA